MHIFVSLIFCVCLHCPLQVSGGDCWLQSHPGTLVINQPSFCLPPHSLPLHLFFYVHIYCFMLRQCSVPPSTPDVVHKIKCRISELATRSSLLSQSIKYKAVTSISVLATRKPLSFLSILLVNHIFDSLPFKQAS